MTSAERQLWTAIAEVGNMVAITEMGTLTRKVDDAIEAIRAEERAAIRALIAVHYDHTTSEIEADTLYEILAAIDARTQDATPPERPETPTGEGGGKAGT